MGFAPGELIRIELHSEPVVLTSVRADSAGELHAGVRLPSDVTGSHTLVAVGETSALRAAVPLRIGAPAVESAPTSGRAGAVLPWLTVAAVLALGAVLLVAASRTSRAA